MPGARPLSTVALLLVIALCWPELLVSGQSPRPPQLLPLPPERLLPECQECDSERCPTLHHCPVDTVKDSCNCCDVCPLSPRPSPTPSPESACSQVQCPKFKVCKENIQGLPLCTCPNAVICETRKRRDICSTEGKTYASRCHLRIEACKNGRRIKVAHRGPCSGDEGSHVVERENVPRRKKNKRRKKKKKKNKNKSKLNKIKKVKNRRQRRRQKQQRKRKQNDQRRRRRRRDRFRVSRSRRRLARGHLRARSEVVS